MFLTQGLVALGAGLALAGNLPVGLGVLYFPALPDQRAGEGGHLAVPGSPVSRPSAHPFT